MERYLRVNFLGPGPRYIKKNLRIRGLTKVEKHWIRVLPQLVKQSPELYGTHKVIAMSTTVRRLSQS